MNSSSAALMALRAFRSSSFSNSNNKWTISRTFASTSKQSSAKPTSSGGSDAVNIEGKNMDPPGNVFKQVDKSALGPGASKQSDYKNPEYFSYHNMSYSEMEIVMAKHRVPQPSSKK